MVSTLTTVSIWQSFSIQGDTVCSTTDQAIIQNEKNP